MEIIVKKQEPLNPAQPAAADPVEKPRLTDAERETLSKQVMSSMGWGNPGTVAPAAAAPAAAPVIIPSIPPVMDNAELIRRTSMETARQTAIEVAKVVGSRETPATAPIVEQFEMTPEDADDYKIIQFLERTGNAKYKGKASEFMDYVKKHYAYQSQWLSANAGKEYDIDADEHTAWYEANQPKGIDEKDLQDGKIKMLVDEGVEHQYQTRIKPKEDALNAQEAYENNMPIIAQNVTNNVVNFTREVSPELAKLITDAEGKPAMSQENIDRLMAADPIAGDIMDEIVRGELEPLLLELEKTTIADRDGNPIFQLNPARNRIHAAIDQFRQETERDLANGPAENRLVNGKQFVTLKQIREMKTKALASGTDDEKRQRLQEIDGTYWALSVDHVEAQIVKTYAAKAKSKIEKADKRARSKYNVAAEEPGSIRQPASTAPPAQSAQPAIAANPGNGKPNAPSINPQSDIVTAGKPGSGGEKTISETVTKSLWG